jgi:hypothetical protein
MLQFGIQMPHLKHIEVGDSVGVTGADLRNQPWKRVVLTVDDTNQSDAIIDEQLLHAVWKLFYCTDHASDRT